MESLIAGYPADGFVFESPEKLRRIVGHFRAHYGLAPHVAPRCNAPWVSAVVESNGDVRPCFFHGVIGNTTGTSLGQVRHGWAGHWVNAVVESNGDVRPCFFHGVIGNPTGTSLGAVLNGPQAIAFREGLQVADNPTCQRCVCSLYVETHESPDAACPVRQTTGTDSQFPANRA